MQRLTLLQCKEPVEQTPNKSHIKQGGTSTHHLQMPSAPSGLPLVTPATPHLPHLLHQVCRL